MILKFSKTIICLVAVMCLLGTSLVAFAVEGDLDFDFNIQPEIPTTQEVTVSVETPKETEKETEKQTEKQTEKETSKKPTKKPTKPHTTEKREEPQDNNVNVNVNNSVEETSTTQPETTEESTDDILPDGSFYVYLERNNGQRRLKTVLNKKGYVPEPEEPIREGYVFVGWYSDPEFKTKWDFLRDQADKPITIYAKWEADDGTIEYDIVIEKTSGGKLQVNPKKASFGEPVVITVKPDEGKRLVQGSVLINGEPTDFLSFVMPKGKVTITAEFEDVPENEYKYDKSKLPLYIAIGVVVAVILVIAVVIAKKRSDFNADLDPNEELVVEDNDGDNWVDETIVVEDGFKDGKKVVENTEPDYGAPNLDEDDFE